MDKENKIPNKIVETYAEDMAKVIEGDQSGLIKKIIHGEEEHEKEKRNLSPESIKNKLFMFLGLFFMAVGGVTLFFFFLNREIPTVPIEKQYTPLIFNDASSSIDVAGLDKDKIIQTVANTINATKVKMGGLEGIYLINNKQDIGLRKFIELVKGNFTPDKNASSISDRFLMGVVNVEKKSFFILLKTNSTADIFDALRAWENKMFLDLHGFFGIDISLETKPLLMANFVDGIIENKNARTLYDKDNKIIMMYVFADENSVIITDTVSATHEIMLRLAASRVKK